MTPNQVRMIALEAFRDVFTKSIGISFVQDDEGEEHNVETLDFDTLLNNITEEIRRLETED